MRVSVEEIERIAKLARLKLTGEERESLSRELNTILEHFRKLGDLDTESVPPTFHTYPDRTPLRADKRATATIGADVALANAPEAGEGHFKVPRVIRER